MALTSFIWLNTWTWWEPLFVGSPGPLAPPKSCAVLTICVFHFFCLFLIWFWWQQLAAGRSLKFASCRGGWGVNALNQVALRWFTQWRWIEPPTFPTVKWTLTTELARNFWKGLHCRATDWAAKSTVVERQVWKRSVSEIWANVQSVESNFSKPCWETTKIM